MRLIIERSLQLSNFEKYLGIVEKSKGKLDMFLPLSFDDNNFCGKVSLCQVINTWVRRTETSSSIFTPLRDEESADNFVRDITGVTSTLMTIHQERNIFTETAQKNLRRILNNKAIAKLDQSSPGINNDGEKYFVGKTGPIRVICFDHSKEKKYQFNEWLYQDGHLLIEDNLKDFYTAAIKHLMKPHKKDLERKALQSDTIDKVTAIIKELFENTHKHAMNGFGANFNIALTPNMRGIFLEIHKGKRKDFLEKTKSKGPYWDYFNNPKLFKTENELKTFLEISIIDSGPGFVQRKKGIELAALNPKVELDILKECLTKHEVGLTKKGLLRVASILDKTGGFFRLRTGRMCIYRDFLLLKKGINEFDTQESERFYAKYNYFDWDKKDRGWTEFPQVEGSVISIFYPLD